MTSSVPMGLGMKLHKECKTKAKEKFLIFLIELFALKAKLIMHHIMIVIEMMTKHIQLPI